MKGEELAGKDFKALKHMRPLNGTDAFELEFTVLWAVNQGGASHGPYIGQSLLKLHWESKR